MIYNPPMGGGASDPYVTGNPATATPGSIPPGAAIEQPQREIVNVIMAAGLTPSAANVGQLLQAIQVLGRIRLTGPSTFYVATPASGGSDATGNGTLAAPWATLGHAYSMLFNFYDAGGNSITIQLAAGTYAPVNCIGAVPGCPALLIVGNTSNPASVIISNTTGAFGSACVYAFFATPLYISGITVNGLVSNGGGFCADTGGFIAFQNCNFGNMGASGYHLGTWGSGRINITGNYTINGSASVHLFQQGGFVQVNTGTATLVTVTLTGIPNFSAAFIAAALASQAILLNALIVFSGAASGVKFTAWTGGGIYSGNNFASFPTGLTAGSIVGGYTS